MASIGILVLMGVVVNNGIVMVEHINTLRRGGLPRTEALVQGCRDRLRPILMTMGCAILGMVPISLSTAQIAGGGPPYYPMARAIAGGLAFSTVVTLLFLPTIYASRRPAPSPGAWRARDPGRGDAPLPVAEADRPVFSPGEELGHRRREAREVHEEGVVALRRGKARHSPGCCRGAVLRRFPPCWLAREQDVGGDAQNPGARHAQRRQCGDGVAAGVIWTGRTSPSRG